MSKIIVESHPSFWLARKAAPRVRRSALPHQVSAVHESLQHAPYAASDRLKLEHALDAASRTREREQS